mgnify:CR=1 FL=1
MQFVADNLYHQFEAAIKLASERGDVDGAKSVAADMAKWMASQGVRMPGPPTPEDELQSQVQETKGGEQFLTGMSSAANLGYQGLRGVAGATDPVEVSKWKTVKESTPYTLAGNLAGNAGMMAALPLRGAASVAGAVGKVPAWLGGRAAGVADATLTSGGVNAALTPGDIGARTEAALYGAAPVFGIGGTQAVIQGGRRMATPSGRRIEVGENIRADVGSDRANLLAGALKRSSPDSDIMGVSPSASMVTNDPVMQVLESGSRAKRSDLWQALDRENAASRWQTIKGAAGDSEQLAKLRADRDAVTTPSRDYAMDKANFEIRQRMGDASSVAQPILNTLDRLETGASRPNAAVQTMAKYVRGELEKGTTPAQLYTVRKMLTDGIANAPTSELSQAARAARPERMQLIKHIDDALDELSQGQWGKYLEQYKSASPTISSKTALQNIIDKLERGIPEGQVPPSMGESAAWKTVGNLRDRFGEKIFGTKVIDQLLPEDRKVLEALITNLKSQSDSMRAKGILGSQTGALGANMGRVDAVTQRVVGAAAEHALPIPGVSIFASKIFDKYGRAAEEELANLLQNPKALAQALERAKTADTVTRGTQRGSSMLGAALRESRQ